MLKNHVWYGIYLAKECNTQYGVNGGEIVGGRVVNQYYLGEQPHRRKKWLRPHVQRKIARVCITAAIILLVIIVLATGYFMWQANT